MANLQAADSQRGSRVVRFPCHRIDSVCHGQCVQNFDDCDLSKLITKGKMADIGKNWYVLRAVSGKEAKLKEYIEAEMKHNTLLSSNVFQVLIPTEKQASLRNGKRVEKEKMRLPGYVFIEAHLIGDVAHTLRFMPNCLGFLGGLDNPSPVPQADINRMLGAAEEAELTNEYTTPFEVDGTVKVVDGPFSGFSGVIEEVNTEKRKLKVMVKIFGRKTPLELGFMQVEKEG